MDILFLAGSALMLLVTVGLVLGCDRLGRRQ